jgi:hypothetical protein
MQQCEKLRLRDPIASGLTKDKLLRRATASAINIIIIIIIIITIKRERERESLAREFYSKNPTPPGAAQAT